MSNYFNVMGLVGTFLLILGAVLIVIGLLDVASDASGDRECTEYGEMVGQQHNYISGDGCYLRTDHGWVNKDKL